jgi:2-enoate reductase
LAGKHQSIIKDLVESYGTWFQNDKRMEDGRMTDRLYPYDHLFSPIQVNSVRIKNRIVMGPMGNVGMADETGRPSNKMIRYYAERAKGGAGLITSGLVPVSYNVEASLTEPATSASCPVSTDRAPFSPAGGFWLKAFMPTARGSSSSSAPAWGAWARPSAW